MKKRLEIFKDNDLLSKNDLFKMCSLYVVGFALSFAPPYINKLMIENMESNHIGFSVFCVLLALTFMSVMINYMTSFYVMGKYTKKTRRNLLYKIFDKSQKMPSYVYNTYGNNSVLGLYMFDSINVSDTIVKRRFAINILIFQSVITLLILAYINYILTLYVIASVPIMIIAISLNNMKLNAIQEKMIANRNVLIGETQNFIMHKKDMYLYNRDEYFENKLNLKLQNFLDSQKSFQFLTLFLKRIPVLITILLPVILLFLGAFYVKESQMTLGTLFFYIGIASQFYTPLSNIFLYITDIKSYRVNVEKMESFLYNKIDNKAYLGLYSDAEDEIYVKDCNIYNEKEDLLYKANLRIKESGFYIIKGPNGSGKSTLFNIIAGIYSPNQIKGDCIINKKYLDNMSILKYPLFFIEGSVEENMFSDNVKNIFHINMEKEIKLNPLNLSSGEAQKVALTRIISEDRDMILLDEPISNLEVDAIAVLKDYIYSNKDNKVIIAIMHDDSFDDIADNIFTIKEGEMEGQNV